MEINWFPIEKSSIFHEFHINFQYRYDVSELNPNGDSYFEITNGLGIRF